MDLIFGNKIIVEPIENIVKQINTETDGYYFKQIGKGNGDSVKVSCPYHSDGQETHPSSYFYNRRDNNKIYYGTFHCFACGKRLPLYSVVGHCFDEDDEWGKQWLIDRFGGLLEDYSSQLVDVLDEDTTPIYLDESILEQFNTKHPYMYQRKLTDSVIERFKIGYDKESNSITFPIWDYSGGLVSISKRCVDKKRFHLDSNKEKPVYLLNFIREDLYNGINYPFAAIVESQLNALTCWCRGIPAVALMGTGSKSQIDILNKSAINTFILMLDGDTAGREGADKLIKNLNSDKLVIDIIMPRDKDVNDLSDDEFNKLLDSYNIHWRIS